MVASLFPFESEPGSVERGCKLGESNILLDPYFAVFLCRRVSRGPIDAHMGVGFKDEALPQSWQIIGTRYTIQDDGGGLVEIEERI